MSTQLRQRALALAGASLVLLAAGCNRPAGDAADGKPLALDSDKDKISYTIGMDMAKSLEPAKDEVDVDVIARAIKDVWAGREPALDEEQANTVREEFSEKMQARQISEMLSQARKNAEDGKKFLEENAGKEGVQTTASGLQYQVLEQGSGAKPGAESVVKVHYKGELLDGTVFDDSSQRSEPATIPLQQVVPGWSEGIRLMNPGSRYRFWIPAELAYGEQGTPGGPIPPNSTLVFDVQLLEIVKR